MNTLPLRLAVGATMTLAGFLLFQVQPVLAKFILPWFGGSATTWTVCLLFFQLALLAGYAYAYAVTLPFGIRTQALAQIALLVIAIAALPITPSAAWKPIDADNPTWRILALLSASVFVPYAVLSTTSPLLQRWLGQVAPDIAVSRFFALSNLGSFFGLISYPFLVEPTLSSAAQTRWWSIGFVVYAICFALCALFLLRAARPQTVRAATTLQGPDGRDPFVLWLALSGLGSVLLLATTNKITQWAAVVPFLWILPLGLYLLTFVIAFGQQRLYRRLPFFVCFAALAGLTLFFARPESASGLLVQIALQCATMFSGCMICHGEMVRLQPAPSRLPVFYLASAIGGALGGIVVTLLAPFVFRDYWEHQIALAAIVALTLMLALRGQAPMRRAFIGVAVLFAVAALVSLFIEIAGETLVVDRIRNFYGVVKVVKQDVADPREFSLAMQQAGVDQGSQFQAADRRLEPACSFGPTSGLGLALAQARKRRDGGPAAPLRIGIIGLGAGMTAASGRAGDTIRYYELNPAVTDLARRHFTFLADTPAKVEVTHGDGRILLERETERGNPPIFDILVIDAFRGASPPMHLMTKEAFDVYRRHLDADGILAINFELDTFEMAPLHRGLAKTFGMGVGWFETPEIGDCEDPVSWALYTADAGFWSAAKVKAALSPWRDGKTDELVWTDTSSNLMSIINWDSVLGRDE